MLFLVGQMNFAKVYLILICLEGKMIKKVFTETRYHLNTTIYENADCTGTINLNTSIEFIINLSNQHNSKYQNNKKTKYNSEWKYLIIR